MKRENMNGFSFRDWQDDYYDGFTPQWVNIETLISGKQLYIEFLNDTSDDYELWLKNNAQKLFYREPYDPSKGGFSYSG